jgi:hypothetical protein
MMGAEDFEARLSAPDNYSIAILLGLQVEYIQSPMLGIDLFPASVAWPCSLGSQYYHE